MKVWTHTYFGSILGHLLQRPHLHTVNKEHVLSKGNIKGSTVHKWQLFYLLRSSRESVTLYIL